MVIGKTSSFLILYAMLSSSLFISDLILKKQVEEIIVTFMAVLELVKIQRIGFIQTKRFGRIKLYDASTEMEYY